MGVSRPGQPLTTCLLAYSQAQVAGVAPLVCTPPLSEEQGLGLIRADTYLGLLPSQGSCETSMSPAFHTQWLRTLAQLVDNPLDNKILEKFQRTYGSSKGNLPVS